MGLDCGAKLAKTILFIFNFVFFLLGAGLLGIGIWITVDKSSLVNLANTALSTSDNAVSNTLTSTSSVQIGAYVLIGVGAFTFLVGFCGCCGACTENKCLLGIFSALIIVIIIIEIVGAILAGVYRNKIDSELQTGLMRLLSKNYIGYPLSKNDGEAISLAWDTVMVTIGCCGVDGATDFVKKSDSSKYAARWYAHGRNYTTGGATRLATIPPTCCKFKSKDFMGNGWKATDFENSLQDKNCPVTQNQSYNKAGEGCMPKIKAFVTNHATILIGVVAAIICLELLVAISAVCLYRAID